MRAELIGHFEPCMTDIYLYIYARMAYYIRTHPYLIHAPLPHQTHLLCNSEPATKCLLLLCSYLYVLLRAAASWLVDKAALETAAEERLLQLTQQHQQQLAARERALQEEAATQQASAERMNRLALTQLQQRHEAQKNQHVAAIAALTVRAG